MPQVDFLIPTQKPTHIACCLMQGFHQLGWEVFANVDSSNWIDTRGISTPFARTSGDFIQKVAQLVHGLLIVDVSKGQGVYVDSLRDTLKHRPVILVNMDDAANFVDYDEGYLTFTTHYNRLALRHGSLRPIGFSLSQDIVDLAAETDLTRKQDYVIKNFTPSFQQSVRNSLELCFIEGLKNHFPLHEELTTPEQYAQELAGATLVAAYGGEYLPPMMRNTYLRERMAGGPQAGLYDFKNFDTESAVLRWDSWRFFEAALFACAPIQLDFDKYGFELPVKPTPWEHYIPIDMTTVSALPARLRQMVDADPDALARIGRQARAWVLEHYAPKPVASYVLDQARAFWPQFFG